MHFWYLKRYQLFFGLELLAFVLHFSVGLLFGFLVMDYKRSCSEDELDFS